MNENGLANILIASLTKCIISSSSSNENGKENDNETKTNRANFTFE